MKVSTLSPNRLTAEFERIEVLPPEPPIVNEQGIKLFADPPSGAARHSSMGDGARHNGVSQSTSEAAFSGGFRRPVGLSRDESRPRARFQTIGHMVPDTKHDATCLGFGPRYLHSTGQVYKGGANSGVFLQITCEDAADLPVPGHRYTFGVVKAAQARGDFHVLAERGRRVLRIHLGPDVKAGLATLKTAMKRVVA